MLRKLAREDGVTYELFDDAGEPVFWVNEYLRYLTYVPRSENTVKAYGYDLQYLVRFLASEGLLIQDLRPRHSIGLLEYLRTSASRTARELEAGVKAKHHPRRPRRLSDASVARALAAVSSFYEFLIVSEVFDDENPMMTVVDSQASMSKRPKPAMGGSSRQHPVRRAVKVRRVERLPRPMPVEDIDKFMSSLHTLRDRAFFLLCLNGGLRPAEALTLEISDIRYGSKQVIVRVRRDDPRGLRTKSQEERVVDLQDGETLRALSEYVMNERPAEGETGLVFLVGRNGKNRARPVSYWAMNRLFARRFAALGMRSPWTTPHALRHTHATLMHEGGMRDMTLQKRLGHKNLASVKIYTRVSDQSVKDDYVAALDEITRQRTE